MKPFLTFKTITLAAYETRPFATTGSVFVCKTASAPFVMNFDGEEDFDMDQGWSIDVTPNLFRMIVFKNLTAAAVTISFYAGGSALSYSSQNTVILAKNPATYIKAGALTIDPDQTITLSGVDGAKTRKQIVITNLENDTDLQVLDPANDVCATVLRRSAWTIETSGVLRIHNGNGIAMAINVAEVFYA